MKPKTDLEDFSGATFKIVGAIFQCEDFSFPFFSVDLTEDISIGSGCSHITCDHCYFIVDHCCREDIRQLWWKVKLLWKREMYICFFIYIFQCPRPHWDIFLPPLFHQPHLCIASGGLETCTASHEQAPKSARCPETIRPVSPRLCDQSEDGLSTSRENIDFIWFEYSVICLNLSYLTGTCKSEDLTFPISNVSMMKTSVRPVSK